MNTDPCPDSSVLFTLVDEPERSSSEIRAHVSRCHPCTAAIAELTSTVHGVRSDAPVHTYDAESFVKRLEESIAQAQRSSVAKRRLSWSKAVAALGALAAAAAMIALAPGVRTRDGADQMTPRGSGVVASARRDVHVAVDVVSHAHAGGVQVVAATADAHTSRDAHLLLSYSTASARQEFRLLCFAVDAKGEVHWLYPAYENASTDPAAVLLAPGKSLTPMPTEAVLDELAPGRVRIIALVGERLLHVSDVEQLAVSPRELDVSKLASQFEDVDIRTWELVLDTRSEGSTP